MQLDGSRRRENGEEMRMQNSAAGVGGGWEEGHGRACTLLLMLSPVMTALGTVSTKKAQFHL